MKINWVGLNFKHDKTFYVSRPSGSGDYVVIFVKTRTIFEFVSEVTIAEPNSVIVFDKGYKQHYYSAEDALVNDFIHFDISGKMEAPILSGILFNKPVQVLEPEVIGSLIQHIANENSSNSPHKTTTIDFLFGALINKIKDQYTIRNENIEGMNALRGEIYSNPHINWSIPQMALKCHLSKTYFQAVYKKTFGVTCMTDVISARCLLAKRLLLDTNYKVYQVAELCGYNNPVHFMRQFKEKNGVTPYEYRMEQIDIKQTYS
jgi:AraC-type DNA-binding domain-containing proteins